MEIISTSPEQTKKFGKQVAQAVAAGDVLALAGELGTGKTTFVQGFLEGLGIQERVTSPTFVIAKLYKTAAGITVFHLDLYRIDDPAQLVAIGFNEIVHDKRAITIVEWAERAKEALPMTAKTITFDRLPKGEHHIHADWLEP